MRAGRVDRGRYRGTSAAVLGASGFIGRWVARLLTAQGCRPSLVVRDRERAEAVMEHYGIHGNVVQADLADFDVLEDVLEELAPEVVFNLVGYGVDRSEEDPERARRVNAALVRRLGEILAGLPNPEWTGATLVHAGSALEYGRAGDVSEESEPEPDTVYGRTKLAGTRALTALASGRDLRVVTARLFTVYGPGEHDGRLLPTLVDAARSGEAVDLTEGSQERDFCFVEEVAEGLLRLGLVREPGPAVVNLATGVLTPVRRFVEIAAQQLRISEDQLRFGALPTRSEEMHHHPVPTGRIRCLAGWAPSVTVEKGIGRSVAFLLHHPELRS